MEIPDSETLRLKQPADVNQHHYHQLWAQWNPVSAGREETLSDTLFKNFLCEAAWWRSSLCAERHFMSYMVRKSDQHLHRLVWQKVTGWLSFPQDGDYITLTKWRRLMETNVCLEAALSCKVFFGYTKNDSTWIQQKVIWKACEKWESGSCCTRMKKN